MKTPNNTDLVLLDLCGRAPYGVVCKVTYTFNNETTGGEDVEAQIDDLVDGVKLLTKEIHFDYLGELISVKDVKPYLRHLSDMTEEEFIELKNYSELTWEDNTLELSNYNEHACLDFWLKECPDYVVILVFDWLNAHHFDYRGLIELGFAIRVTPENNPYKE